MKAEERQHRIVALARSAGEADVGKLAADLAAAPSEGLFLARLCAATTLVSLPVVLAGWLAQKQLVRGLSKGAVK